jgi:hypothetical protein
MLVEQTPRPLPGRIARMAAHDGYNTYDNFDFLAGLGIDQVIKMRSNASTKRQGMTWARRIEDPANGYNVGWKVSNVFRGEKKDRRVGKVETT